MRMAKCLHFVLLCVSALLLVSQPVLGANLLLNPGFETPPFTAIGKGTVTVSHANWMINWNIPPCPSCGPYSGFGYAYQETHFAQFTDRGPVHKRNADAVRTEGDWPGSTSSPNEIVLWQEVTAVGNCPYTASVYVWPYDNFSITGTHGFGANSADHASMTVEEISLGGTVTAHASRVITTPQTAWVRLEDQFVSLSSTVKLRIKLRTVIVCDLWHGRVTWDDASIDNSPPTFSVSGQVSSGGTGLQGANVAIDQVSVTSGTNGAYSLLVPFSVPTVTIRASKLGYFAQRKSRTVSAGGSVPLNYDLIATGNNICLNAGFDDGWSTGGWRTVNAGGTAGPESSLTATSKRYDSGEEAMAVYSSGNGAAEVSQIVPIKPSTQYTTRCRFYGVGPSWGSNANQKAALRIRQYNAVGAQVSQDVVYATSSSGWQTISTTLTTNPSALTLEIACWANLVDPYSSGGARAVFDSVELLGPVGSPQSIGLVSRFPDGSYALLQRKPVTAAFSGFFYIEEPDRSAGIKVMGSANVGELASVLGSVTTLSGEKTIVPTSLGIESGGSVPKPLLMRVPAQFGLSPVGLYVTICGQVKRLAGGTNSFVLSDGSHEVKVYGIQSYQPLEGDFVQVTGVLGSEEQSIPVLRGGNVKLLRGDTQWLQYRRDRLLTGRSPMKGNMTVAPGVKWKQFIGSRETLLGVRISGSGSGTVNLPTSDLNPSAYDPTLGQWGMSTPTYDLDGNGILTPISPSPHYKVGKLLPEVAGLQKVEFDSVFSHGGDETIPCYGKLYVRQNSQWTLSWQSQAIPHQFQANAIAGDFDNNGTPEIALTPWYDVYVLNAQTGALKTNATFKDPNAESGRAYGWFGAFDLNQDSKKELVILSDFEPHIDVMGWQNGQLVKVWGRLIEAGVTMRDTIFKSITNPVEDVDGDGIPEICASIYNEYGDHKWHVQVIEGMTGLVKHDLINKVLVGLRDVDGDGVYELFCAAAYGQTVTDVSDLTVLSLKNGNLNTLWQESGAMFQKQPLQNLPLHVNSGATDGLMALLAGPVAPGGLPVFFTRKTVDAALGTVQINIWQSNGVGSIMPLGSLTGPNLEVLAVRPVVDPAISILVRARVYGTGSQVIQRSDTASSLISSRLSTAPVSPAVIGRLDGKRPAVVVEAAGEQLVAVQVAPGNSSPEVKWRVPGRGMFTGDSTTGGGWPNGGVVLADLNGDGSLETVAATRAPSGVARLVALGPTGLEVWHHDFENLPGAPPPWNVAGLCLWPVGHFTDPGRCDIFVSTRPASYEGYLLDGRTGETIWYRKDINGSHCGGMMTAAYDLNSDGLDDILSMYIHISALDGPTSNTLFYWNTGWGGMFATGTMSGIPAMGDFVGDGTTQMLYTNSSYMLSVLRTNGTIVWQKGIVDGILPTPPYIMAGGADIDGDGKMEVISHGYRPDSGSANQIVRCYNGANGAQKWSMQLQGWATSSAITADVDSDGREECLFAIDNTLYAIGANISGTAGEIRWTKTFSGYVGTPAIADVTGDGKMQIVVVCGDGYVYGLGSSQ